MMSNNFNSYGAPESSAIAESVDNKLETLRGLGEMILTMHPDFLKKFWSRVYDSCGLTSEKGYAVLYKVGQKTLSGTFEVLSAGQKSNEPSRPSNHSPGTLIASRHYGNLLDLSDCADEGFMRLYLKKVIDDALEVEQHREEATTALRNAFSSWDAHAYQSMINRLGTIKHDDRGLMAEVSVYALIEQLNIDVPGSLGFSVQKGSPVRDMKGKLDLILIPDRVAGVSVLNVSADTRKWGGVQLTTSRESIDGKMSDIKKVLGSKVSLDKVMLLYLDKEIFGNGLKHWKKGRGVRGPWGHINNTFKAEVFSALKTIMTQDKGLFFSAAGKF